MVGLRSLNLEEDQRALQAEHASVAEQTGEVHKLARRLIEVPCPVVHIVFKNMEQVVIPDTYM